MCQIYVLVTNIGFNKYIFMLAEAFMKINGWIAVV